jgi:hypothetical protein
MTNSPSPLFMASNGLRESYNEKTSSWVDIPAWRGKYLLPKIATNRKFVPVFYQDGSVGQEPIDLDPDLAKLADEFVYSTTAEVAKEKKILVGLATYGKFIKLLKALILKNYDLPDEQLTQMLSFNAQELVEMFQIIFVHCKDA